PRPRPAPPFAPPPLPAPAGLAPGRAGRAGRPRRAGSDEEGDGMVERAYRAMDGRKRRRTPVSGGPSQVRARRRPTLPGPLDPSTIGAGGLNFRVRNGNGWDPSAMATEIWFQERSRWA